MNNFDFLKNKAKHFVKTSDLEAIKDIVVIYLEHEKEELCSKYNERCFDCKMRINGCYGEECALSEVIEHI